MLGFVAILRKVQIMRHNMVLVGGSQGDLHIEFTPSLFCDSEWGVFEGYNNQHNIPHLSL